MGQYRRAFQHARPAVNLALLIGHSAHRLGTMSGTLDRAANTGEVSAMAETLEQAVHKMTGLSAKTFNLRDRGLVRTGYHADLVLFDPDRIEDAATYEEPVRPARGIHSVFVNGAPVWSNGASTGRGSGTFITH